MDLDVIATGNYRSQRRASLPSPKSTGKITTKTELYPPRGFPAEVGIEGRDAFETVKRYSQPARKAVKRDVGKPPLSFLE